MLKKDGVLTHDHDKERLPSKENFEIENTQMIVFEERDITVIEETYICIYLSETCSESTAGERASEGYVGFGIATPHHC